jgi:Xaa-Pro dipeptidase
MSVNRRKFLSVSALTAGSLGMSSSIFGRQLEEQETALDLPEAIRSLSPQLAGIVPITVAERKARIEKAQELMSQNKIDAILAGLSFLLAILAVSAMYARKEAKKK